MAKRIFAIILTGIMIFSLTACENDKNDKNDKTDKVDTTKAPSASGDAEASEIKTMLFALSYDDSIWKYYEESTIGVELLNKKAWNKYIDSGSKDDFNVWLSNNLSEIEEEFNASYGQFWNSHSDGIRKDFETFYSNLGNYTEEYAQQYAEQLGLDWEVTGLNDIFKEQDATERITNALAARGGNGNQIAASMVGSLGKLEKVYTGLADQFLETADKVESYSRKGLYKQAFNLGTNYINAVDAIEENAGENSAALINL